MTAENRNSLSNSEGTLFDLSAIFAFIYRNKYRQCLEELRQFATELEKNRVNPVLISETIAAHIQHYCEGMPVHIDEKSLDVFAGNEAIYRNWSTYVPQEETAKRPVSEEALDSLSFYG